MEQMTPFPPEGVDTGATNTSDPGSGATETVQAATGDLRADLAAIIAHPKMPAPDRRYFGGGGCDRCPKALDAADAVIEAGFRLVSDDEATVDRVARALVSADGHTVDEVVAEGEWDVYPVLARAAVRALREAGTEWVPGDPVYPNESARRWCTTCLTGWTGGPEQCPGCGRDAVEGCASCGARDGCPACIVPPKETP